MHTCIYLRISNFTRCTDTYIRMLLCILQGIVMGLTVGAGASARVISPYWCELNILLPVYHTITHSVIDFSNHFAYSCGEL